MKNEKNESFFNEQKTRIDMLERIDELVAMEKGFNIAKEGKFDTFLAYQKEMEATSSRKEYEILSFYLSERVFIKYEDDLFRCDAYTGKGDEWSESYLLNHEKGYKIRSIKRLSDGEVFTVGDKITYNTIKEGSWEGGDWCEIEKYSLNNGGIFINSHYLGSPEIKINDWVKAREVLFTTEDGKEVFEGQRVWYVNNDFNIDFYDFNKMSGKDDLKHYPEMYKYLSTKEAAEEYVLMNKPLLSVKDITDLFCVKGTTTIQIGTDAFTYIIVSKAKSKLSN